MQCCGSYVKGASPANMAGIAPTLLFFFFSSRLSYLKTARASTPFIQPHSFFQPITSQDEPRWVDGVVLSGG
jgi:hypothetical protein